jgi:putative transposase
LKVQSELLSISRASLYYKSKEPTSNEIQIKHRLDELYTDYPFLGSRRIVEILEKEGIVVGRHTVRSYREQMGLVTIYPKPKLSLPGGAGHLLYPYLLRELVIDRPNQVWGVDITYIRMVRGWTYLVAFMDWYSRYVVSWKLSSTLEMGFVLDCRDAALNQAVPEIVNSDQGSHFTSEKFVNRWLESGVQVSMDGRGRCMDNIFTERLWRSVKWEEVYLREYENASEAHAGLERYFDFYNQVRPHQSLGYATPAQVYAGTVIPEAICISKPVKATKAALEIVGTTPVKPVAPSVLS